MEKELEEARNAYIQKFGIPVPIFFELSEDDYLTYEFIDAIYDAIREDKSDIDISDLIDEKLVY